MWRERESERKRKKLYLRSEVVVSFLGDALNSGAPLASAIRLARSISRRSLSSTVLLGRRSLLRRECRMGYGFDAVYKWGWTGPCGVV